MYVCMYVCTYVCTYVRMYGENPPLVHLILDVLSDDVLHKLGVASEYSMYTNQTAFLVRQWSR